MVQPVSVDEQIAELRRVLTATREELVALRRQLVDTSQRADQAVAAAATAETESRVLRGLLEGVLEQHRLIETMLADGVARGQLDQELRHMMDALEDRIRTHWRRPGVPIALRLYAIAVGRQIGVTRDVRLFEAARIGFTGNVGAGGFRAFNAAVDYINTERENRGLAFIGVEDFDLDPDIEVHMED